MKRQHEPSEQQLAGADLPEHGVEQRRTHDATATSDAAFLPPPSAGLQATPGSDAWWEDEGEIAHSGGVCLLIA